jgi:hypothetical protein
MVPRVSSNRSPVNWETNVCLFFITAGTRERVDVRIRFSACRESVNGGSSAPHRAFRQPNALGQISMPFSLLVVQLTYIRCSRVW